MGHFMVPLPSTFNSQIPIVECTGFLEPRDGVLKVRLKCLNLCLDSLSINEWSPVTL